MDDYIRSLGADQDVFEEHMNQYETLSFEEFNRLRGLNAEATLSAKNASKSVLVVPSQRDLANLSRARSIKEILRKCNITRGSTVTAVPQINIIISELKKVKHQWEGAQSAGEVCNAYKSLHKWGFKSGKTLLMAIRDLEKLLLLYLSHCDDETQKNYKLHDRDDEDQGSNKKPRLNTTNLKASPLDRIY